MRAYERFLRYIKIFSTSDPAGTDNPTTQRQFDMAHLLRDEMEAMGLSDVRLTDNCYVYGVIPATPGYEKLPGLGFIAHMDTAPDFNGENIRPRVIENYDGGEVELGCGRRLTLKDFPHLPSLAGQTLIVTDGSTLLGADDKAGVAEILTMAERLLAGEIPHGKICIGFTPDEEVGLGPKGFDVPGFGAAYAYTVDGGSEGSVTYENFNAAAATLEFAGVNIHPGEAKDVMVNACLVAMEANALLPGADTPARTEGYEGFFHLMDMKGNVEHASLSYIIRDHDATKFAMRKDMLAHIEKFLNEKYGAGTVTLKIRDQYKNMTEKILPCYHLIENAAAAAVALGLDPATKPVRGGTDGATLSFMGLPCPNLGFGGHGPHGPYEHITYESMDQSVELLMKIVAKYAEG